MKYITLILCFLYLLISPFGFAELSEVDQQRFTQSWNLLKNAGFESGRASWVRSGSEFITTTTTANVGRGLVSGEFDADGAADYFQQTVAVPAGLKGNSCAAKIKYIGGDTNLTFKITDGTNTLASGTLVAATYWQWSTLTFVCPTSGNLVLRIESTADAAIARFDDMFMGYNIDVLNISQAEMVGSLKYPAIVNCVWSGAFTTFANFAADTDCNTPTTTGKAVAPATKIPAIKFDSLSPGYYFIVATGSFYDNPTSSIGAGWRFSDGSSITTMGQQNDSDAVTNKTPMISGFFNLASAIGTTTINIQVASEDGSTSQTFEIYNNQITSLMGLEITLYRFPLSSEKALRFDTINQSGGVTIIANASHDAQTTSGSYATMTDSDIIAGDKTHYGSAVITTTAGDLGFKMPTLNPGNYMVYGVGRLYNAYNSSTGHCNFAIGDGSSNIGQIHLGTASTNTVPSASYIGSIFSYTSVQTNKEFLIKGYRASGDGTCGVSAINGTFEMHIIPISNNLPYPNLVQAVTTPSAGHVKVASAYITNSGTPTVTRQDGNWISSLTDNGVGITTINITSGIFSIIPNCTCMLWNTSTTAEWCNGSLIPTLSALKIETQNGAGTKTDKDFSVICIGEY